MRGVTKLTIFVTYAAWRKIDFYSDFSDACSASIDWRLFVTLPLVWHFELQMRVTGWEADSKQVAKINITLSSLMICGALALLLKFLLIHSELFFWYLDLRKFTWEPRLTTINIAVSSPRRWIVSLSTPRVLLAPRVECLQCSTRQS